MEFGDLIMLMKEYTKETNKDGELGEQEAAASGGGGGAVYPTVTKWETGISRSVANQIDSKTKWRDLYKITRGKANTLL